MRGWVETLAVALAVINVSMSVQVYSANGGWGPLRSPSGFFATSLYVQRRTSVLYFLKFNIS
jgi:hypothetical protein